MSPVMAAGLTLTLRDMADVLHLIDRYQPQEKSN
jgi:hypothetical protein